MRTTTCAAVALAVLAPVTTAAAAAPPLPPSARRFAVVAGANRGAADRVALRYAVSDAERFAKVVTRMGGVAPEDCMVLREPTRRALLDALAGVRTRAEAARAAGGHVDVIVYFSGHADERGLMLGRELLSYRDLRSALGEIGADVGITILDACASGAITRLKGGQPHPAFLTDASTQVQGYAFLTSSSENEAAQESERLQGSFFTQALLTGLRGAADTSGDGRVTLGEAYQFAFTETLAQTTTSQAGAQHPAYDIKMAGTGDVVLTDVRENSATLVLGPDYDGRFFVLGPRGLLVAELYKPYGRTVELGLEPGEYEVFFEQEQRLLATPLHIREGQRQELARDDLHPTRRMPTRSRGPAEPPPAAKDLIDGRTHLQVSFGVTGIDVTSAPAVDEVKDEGGGAFSFSYGLRKDVALDVTFDTFDVFVRSTPAVDQTSGLWGVFFGARYYPPVQAPIRPYVGGAIGPATEFGAVSSAAHDVVANGGTHFGGVLRGGADVYLGSHFTLGAEGRFFMVTSEPSRFVLRMALGWAFGGRH